MFADSPLPCKVNPQGHTKGVVLVKHSGMFLVFLYCDLRKGYKGDSPGLCAPGGGVTKQDDWTGSQSETHNTEI